MSGFDRQEMRRRFHAARVLAAPTEAELAERQRGPKPQKVERSPGITVPELAKRLAPVWDIGVGTLGRVERGVRELEPAELLAIANACGLPYEFFTTPLNGVALRDEIRDRLERIEALLAEDDQAARDDFAAAFADVDETENATPEQPDASSANRRKAERRQS